MASDTDALTSNDSSDKLATHASSRSNNVHTHKVCMAATAEAEAACIREATKDNVNRTTSSGLSDSATESLPNGCVKGLHSMCSPTAATDLVPSSNNTEFTSCGKPTDFAAIVSEDRRSSISDDKSNSHDPAQCCTDTADVEDQSILLSTVSMDDSGAADLSYIPPPGGASGSSSNDNISEPVPGPSGSATEIREGIEHLSIIAATGVPCCEIFVVSDLNGIEYVEYESERQMEVIMQLITKDLSEPYSVYTYRYFIHSWPRLCFLAMDKEKCVGAIVCKLDRHKTGVRRGYIAMLAVDHDYRKMGIGSNLVMRSINSMMNPVSGGCDEVVLETEISNSAALHLYEKLGFVRDKRLFRYYLNGVDALRLKLWLR